MGLELSNAEGQTPLDEEERDGLLIPSIATRGELDELAIRFKHRLVSIHCFPNGNGRHSRLMADIIIEKIYKQPVFSWGANNSDHESDMRSAYLRAVKNADKGDFDSLIQFARS
jgi:fido (protein-threonine AMPylation protein)